MNFPSPADGRINSPYHLEDVDSLTLAQDHHASYLLEEQVHRMSIQDQHQHHQHTSAYDYVEAGSLNNSAYVEQQQLYYSQHHEPLSLEHEYVDQTALTDPNNYSWEQASPVLDQNLDTIITELGPEEIRWFYKTDTDKRWTEFSGYDSFKIEFEYRQYTQEWNAYAYNHGASAATCGVQQSQQAYYEQSTNTQQSTNNSQISSSDASNSARGMQTESSSKHQIVVRGGMYEVDLTAWRCYSIFWPGEEFLIHRGIWFYEGTWQPVEYPHSEQIENIHLQLFLGHRLADYVVSSSTKPPREVCHTESFTAFHVDWHSPTSVHLHSEAGTSKLVRSVTQRLGFQKPTGYRLLRGYKTLATDTDRPTDVTHLVFVIHGIGQKMDTGRIIRNSNSFRDSVSWLQNKYFTKSHHRAEFFPVEWRSSLKLDGDIVQAITPLHLDKLRQLLNASAMDIMYYTSPLFGKEIQGGLCNELNRLYSMFMERNPYFESNGGKVSIIAHSLGCVILYDIVTGWMPFDDPASQRQQVVESNGRGKSGLLFKIENFFGLGSPLAVFLALRYKDPHEPEQHSKVLPPELCKRLYNIFHPADAVAYRMEPLLERAYKLIAPLPIHAYNGGNRTPYELMPLEPLQPDGGTASGRRSTNPEQEREEAEGANNSAVSPPTPSRGKSSTMWDSASGIRDRWSLWSLMRGNRKTSDGTTDSPHHETVLRGLEHRLDFVLRESQLTASYIAAITSHTAYWDNYDVALFVLTRLFPEMEQNAQPISEGCEPPSPPEFCG